ncbi:helix-turn-helix domain-containing protein [Alkalihalobacterium chitinilyticum]|uniref:Helix-turn-helix domain-containing protein n=1 Tax=Alkalihalobacterium chitinilyticum TaxID=2980103 RepID=A0ABT5VCP7_9BACI|nr:helix-turn-helix domain-containing protein [Alkalihalobacterium chitinilyticum]MDE5413227.1 helix-turn-helix domain-containing protein [Alkalihalobacterium chitinilyticum]
MRDWLKNVRKERGLTQEEVASSAFINRAFYTQIENGSRNPSFEVAKNIATILGISPSAFYTNEFSEPFQLALRNSPMIIAHCDLELRYTWIFNQHPDFDPENSVGKRDDELAVNEGTLALMALKQEVIRKGKQMQKKICFPLTDGVHCYYVFAEPLVDSNSEIVGVVTASMDITEFTPDEEE